MLIPMILGAINKPLQLAYKAGRLAAHVRQARLPLNKLDCMAAFMLDLKGKGKLGLIWLVSKLVHGKVTNAQRAGKMSSWIDAHRTGPTDKSLESDLDKWIAATRPPPTPPAKPTAAAAAAKPPAATNMTASSAGTASVAPAKAPAPAAKTPAAPSGPPRDPLSRAGFVFLRDCLARLQAGEEEVRQRFTAAAAAAGGGAGGPLNVQEALAALYGTGTVYRLSDALAASARRGSSSTPEDAESIQHLLDEVYVELRVALRRDLMDMLVY